MRQMVPALAILSVILIACECSAQAPGRQNRQGGKRGADAGGQRRAAQGQRPGAGAERDPAQMVARMMDEFDKDGDQKLDAKELTALFVTMRERRAGGARGGAPSRQNSDAGRPSSRESAEKSRRKRGENRRSGGDEAEKPGGETPTRPEA